MADPLSSLSKPRERKREKKMILRKSNFETRNFFKKTLERFKYLFFSREYQRLPKTSLSDHSYDQSENLYAHLTDPLDFIRDDSKPIKTPPLKVQKEILPRHSETSVGHGSPSKYNQTVKTKEKKTQKRLYKQNLRKGYEGRKKLGSCRKALEKMCHVDHMADIEEGLYHYSPLPYPAYLEIVERFFMEFFVSSSPTYRSSTKARSS